MSSSKWKAEVLLSGSWRGATSVLISTGRHHIVVDTGLPHEGHQLVGALAQRGLKPSDIGTVIDTHFHVDHVLNNSLFPSSEIYGSQQSYDWCRALYSDLMDDLNWEKLVLKYYPETFEYDRAGENLAKMRKFTLRWWNEKRLGEPSQFRWIERMGLPEGLKSIITSGHVPGHVSVIVPTGGAGTVVAGDALVSRENSDHVMTMIPHNRQQFHLDSAQILAMPGRILPGHDREFTSPADTPKPPKK